MAKAKKYIIYSGPFAEKAKAVKQTVAAQNVVADTNITIINNMYMVNICETKDKKSADTLKAVLAESGVGVKVKAVTI